MSDTFEKLIESLSTLDRLPAATLTFLACIVVGYLLKRSSCFPNEAIPWVVVMMAMMLTWFLAPPRGAGDSVLSWRTRQALAGMIIGFVAWIFHAQVLKRLEERLPWLKGLASPGPSDSTKSEP